MMYLVAQGGGRKKFMSFLGLYKQYLYQWNMVMFIRERVHKQILKILSTVPLNSKCTGDH